MAMQKMSEFRERLFAAYPQARKIDRALASSDNPTPLFFMNRTQDSDLAGSWYALGRLGRTIERQFNINGEVLIVFSPWQDFQRRSYNAITQRLFDEVRVAQGSMVGERFTPDKKLVIIVSPDPDAGVNIMSWNRGGSPTLAVYLPADNGSFFAAADLIGALAATLSLRDLYGGRNPVTGDDFFGRNELLEKLAAQIDAGQNIALLGFRRSGKTSVLLELRRRLLPRGTIMSVTDLAPHANLDDLPQAINADVLTSLRSARDSGRKVWIGSEAEQGADIGDYGQLSARLRKIAGSNAEFHFVIALDEIECLTPFIDSDPQGVRSLLGALRAAAQTHSNMTIAFTGIANRSFARSTLGSSLENPIFGYVDTSYLRPFRSDETLDLVRDLGSSMLLDWSDDAVLGVHHLTGGVPFFARSLASAVRELAYRSRPDGKLTVVQVTDDLVADAAHGWRAGAASEWREIEKSMWRHYEGVKDLLDAEEADELNEWIASSSEHVEAAQILVGLQLLDHDDAGYTFSESLQSVKRLDGGMRRKVATTTRATGAPEQSIDQLLAGSESHLVEYKQTARVNAHTGEKDLRMEDAIVKTIAGFLNSDGGTLLIGVADDGTCTGVSTDIAVTRNHDFFLQWITGTLLGSRLGKSVTAQYVRASYVEVTGVEIVRVDVKPSSEPVWAEFGTESLLYVRNGNLTDQLKGNDVSHFLRRRMA